MQTLACVCLGQLKRIAQLSLHVFGAHTELAGGGVVCTHVQYLVTQSNVMSASQWSNGSSHQTPVPMDESSNP